MKGIVTKDFKIEVDDKLLLIDCKVDPSLIGGFVLEFDNNLVDASVVRDLRDIKKQFQQNLFVPQIK